IMGDLQGYMTNHVIEMQDTPIKPKELAKMIELIENGTISSKSAKKVFAYLDEEGGDIEAYVKEQVLGKISDKGELSKSLGEVLDANEQSVADFKDGKGRALGFLVGQVMKATQGQANPQMVNEILKEEIEKR